jgi:hypothetical protein
MKLATARPGVILLFASLLQACGGGGNGDGGDSGSDARLTVSPKTVSVAATPGDASPSQNITLTVSNPPASGLFLEASGSSAGIATIDFVASSTSQGTLIIDFRAPSSLQNNTYTDTITLRVCPDDQCASEIRGSPATVTTSYVVSGDGPSSVTLDRDTIQVAANTNEQFGRTETARLTLSAAPASGIYVQENHSSNGIEGVSSGAYFGTSADVSITFAPTQQLGTGSFNDTVNLTVCYDPSCVRQVNGSPFTISTTLSVGVAAEPGLPQLEVTSRVALPHDVIDAEFSKALNRIVMVGSYPVNALYVYDVATATEYQQLLAKTPTSVSVAPDGLTAAVGHDALISVVDLTRVGLPGAPAPIGLNVSADVFDVVLDGLGSVHAFPRVDQWVEPHSIHIATNTEQIGSFGLRAGSHARLHPSGGFIYTADNGLSPSDIEKWDITSGVAMSLYDSPYHGDYGMCGDLWFHETGITIYTACGNTFRSSTIQTQDMVYSGALELSTSGFSNFMIRSLSQSDAHDEISLIEYDVRNCSLFAPTGPCFTHLAFYESLFLNRLAVYGIGPVTVNAIAYGQHGLFVFYDAIGTNKYLISKLEGMPNPDAEYYLSVIP